MINKVKQHQNIYDINIANKAMRSEKDNIYHCNSVGHMIQFQYHKN